MRNPVRGEADAFYIAYGGAVLIGVSIVLGVLVHPAAGVALFAGGLIGAFVWDLSTKDPNRRRALAEAASAGRRETAGDQRRVLIVANRTLQGTELQSEVRKRATDGAALRVVAPILTSRAHYIATDVDSELREARERLAHAIAWAQGEGFTMTGKVGDPIAALGAIEDELRGFGPDEVIISTHPPGKSNWLETGIVERLRDELDIPVTHVIVDLEAPVASAT